MYKKKIFYITLGTLIGISLFCFLLAVANKFSSLSPINMLFAPLQKDLFVGTQQIAGAGESTLRKENESLQSDLVRYKNIQKDDAALRDQFQTASIPSKRLLPAHIIGEPGFIPGQNAIEDIVIDQGTKDGIKNGMAVIYKDNLLGKIVETTSHTSHVVLISNATISFPAKTVTNDALGVVKGQSGGELILDDVTLSQTLQDNDLVETIGTLSMQGVGYPPDLIVGKITNVQKDPSALFQRADVESLIDITKISMVFVYTGTK